MTIPLFFMKIFNLACLFFVAASGFAQLGEQQLIVQLPTTQNEIFPLDLDNDGDLDIISTNGDGILPFYFVNGLYYSNGHTADQLRICINDGSATFSEQPLFSLANRSLWHFGDANNDQLLDFLFVDNNEVFLQLNEGNLGFSSAQMIYQNTPFDCGDPQNELLHFPDQIKRVCAGDVNNDGLNDILFAASTSVCVEGISYPDSYELSLYAMFSDGNVFLPAEKIYTTSPTSASFEDVGDLDVTDVDGDGQNEMVLTAGYGGSFWEVHVIDNPLGYYESSYTSSVDEIILENADDTPGMDGIGFSNMEVGYSEVNIQFMNSNYVSQWVSANVITENVSTARFDVIDLYQDGFGDFVISGSNGQIEILEHDVNNLMQGYTSVMMLETGIPQLLNMRSGDLDGDGAEDLILMNEGNIFVMAGNQSTAPATVVTLSAFYDENANGIYDGMDTGWSHLPFELNGSLSFTNANGEFNFSAHNGVFNFLPQINTELFDFSTPGSLTFSLEEGMPDTTLYIGIIPIGEQIHDVEVYGNPSTMACALEVETQHITIVNSGNTFISGEIIYPVNPYYTYLSSSTTPIYVSTDTIIWDYNMLAPGQSYTVNVTVDPPGLEEANQNLTLTFIATILDENGSQIHMDTDRHSFVLRCSYDPNDIHEKNGHTEFGYVFADDTLDYTIRFQNTGNAPAYNVRLENQLSDLLQRNTILPVASSHNFLLSIDSDGLATFRFDNIMLPDSASDEPNSHGFVRYLILPTAGLAPGTIIENTAGIFFDLNPPVITNTEITTIYDCADLEQVVVSDQLYCNPLQMIAGVNSALWVDTVLWFYNNELAAMGNATIPVGNGGSLMMVASNALCEFSESWTFEMNGTTAGFVQNSNELIANNGATWQWYLNGTAIDGATEQTFMMTESGNYSVSITNQAGCPDMSEALTLIYTSILSSLESGVLVFPIPAQDEVQIKLNKEFIGLPLSVVDMTGKVVLQVPKILAENMRLDVSHLAWGIYTMQIGELKLPLVVQ